LLRIQSEYSGLPHIRLAQTPALKLKVGNAFLVGATARVIDIPAQGFVPADFKPAMPRVSSITRC
jgi:hypothetical protein